MPSLRVSLQTRIEQCVAMGFSDGEIRRRLPAATKGDVAWVRDYLERVIREPDQLVHAHGKQAAT